MIKEGHKNEIEEKNEIIKKQRENIKSQEAKIMKGNEESGDKIEGKDDVREKIRLKEDFKGLQRIVEQQEEVIKIQKESIDKLEAKIDENDIVLKGEITNSEIKIKKHQKVISQENEKEVGKILTEIKTLQEKTMKTSQKAEVDRVRNRIEQLEKKTMGTMLDGIRKEDFEKLRKRIEKAEKDIVEVEKKRGQKNVTFDETRNNSNNDIRYDQQKYQEKGRNTNQHVKDERKVGVKKVNSHVILIMDSNRRYIDAEKFWRGKRCTKIAAGNVEEVKKTMEQVEFINTKHIIVHVGTNDLEIEKDSPETICRNIIKVGVDLKSKYKMTRVFISQLPPRGDEYNSKRNKVNHLLAQSLPESLMLINNSNLTHKDLHDKKHIRREAIRTLVMNMKNAIKESRDIPTRMETTKTIGEGTKKTDEKELYGTLKEFIKTINNLMDKG